MKAFLHHLKFEFFSGLRNKTLLLMYYLLPIGFYLIIGSMMPGINPPFLLTLIPTMVCFSILSGTLLGLPTPLVEAREAGIFRSDKVHGVPLYSILFIPTLSMALHLLFVSLFIYFTAPLLFKAPLPPHPMVFIGGLLLSILSLSGTGTLIGVISPSSRTTILYSQIIYLPSMMISGLMVPSELLPSSLQRIARILPTTYGMEVLRSDSFFHTPSLILFIGGVIAYYLSFYLFSWDRKNDPRSIAPAFFALTPYLLAMVLY